MPPTAGLPGFRALNLAERQMRLAERCAWPLDRLDALDPERGLDLGLADRLSENVIGIMGLPLGLALNFLIDGQERLIPMATEEPSVVAAASSMAKLVRDCGGFYTEADPPLMIGQVLLVDVADPVAAQARLHAARPELCAAAAGLLPGLTRLGGGLRDLECRLLPDEGDGGGPILVVHLLVDCRDAMGANLVNTLAEGLAPRLAQLASGQAVLRILSNLADRRLARAQCTIPVDRLGRTGHPGPQVARNMVWAQRLAARDPYRAATHNKGIMNGIDAVALATGQDWRALEAGAHAYAAREGRYQPLTRLTLADDALRASLELPLAVGTVGGSTRVHPVARLCLELLGATEASTLARIMAAVGLAQNLAALRALAAEGIQAGHLRLHARKGVQP